MKSELNRKGNRFKEELSFILLMCALLLTILVLYFILQSIVVCLIYF
jgi:hypothetical protein